MKAIKKLIKWILASDGEFTKKWIRRLLELYSIMIVFYIFGFQELIILHIKYGLSLKLCSVFVESLTKVVICVLGTCTVSFGGYMWKAYNGKREEENVKLKKEVLRLKKGDDENEH